MTDAIAARARTNALSLEVKKDGFSQRQDGSLVLRLKCHPNDMPDEIMKAPMGTRYMAVLVEVEDNGEPKEADTRTVSAGDQQRHEAVVEAPKARSEVEDIPGFLDAKKRKPVAPEKRLAQQAGICCANPVFRRFIGERQGLLSTSEEVIAEAVRRICGVNTRSEIQPGLASARAWESLHSEFLIWRDHPDLVPDQPLHAHQNERAS